MTHDVFDATMAAPHATASTSDACSAESLLHIDETTLRRLQQQVCECVLSIACVCC
jgi:hypothetical protein